MNPTASGTSGAGSAIRRSPIAGPGGVCEVYIAPRSPLGRRTLVLLLITLAYLYLPVYMLIPDSWRVVRVAVAVLVPLVAVASVVMAGLAIVRNKDRSVLLIGVAGITLLTVVAL